MKAEVTWSSGMTFEIVNRGITSRMDSSPEFGGSDLGPTPKESVLNAMCACSGMDVITLAKKMRLDLKTFQIKASAEKTKTTPSYFESVQMNFFLEGIADQEKLIKCVVLSMTKYCGVSYMISKVCPINYEIHINGKSVLKATAEFTLEGSK